MTPASRLRAWRVERRLSLNKLSRQLDCDPSMLSRIESETRSPGREGGLRERIQEVCNIPVDAWDAAESQPTVAEG